MSTRQGKKMRTDSLFTFGEITLERESSKEDRNDLRRRVSADELRGQQGRADLIERQSSLVLENHSSNGTASVIPRVVLLRLNTDFEERMQSAEDGEVLRADIGRRRENQRSHRERSVALHFGFGVVERAEEESEEVGSEGGDASFHSVDDLGEGSNRGRTISGRSCDILQSDRVSIEHKSRTTATDVVLLHRREESREHRGEFFSENSRDRSDQIAGGADQSSVVLGLLPSSDALLLVVLVDLTRSGSLENLDEMVDERFDVWQNDVSPSQSIERNDVHVGAMRAGPTAIKVAEKLTQSSFTTSLHA